jgi:hypothetical protein
MSYRPAAVNGKRSEAWGTLHVCPACGRCLCFACHPLGPCVDDAAMKVLAGQAVAVQDRGNSTFPAGWTIGVPAAGARGVSGLRMARPARDAAMDRAR